jgi:hypothetical protein
MGGYVAVIAMLFLLALSGQAPNHESSAKEPNCHSAKVMTGESPGRINITVECRSDEKNRPFDIRIGRYPLSGNNAPSGIKAFRHRPPLVGSGGGFAHCRRARGDVICEGRSQEHVRMLPVIYVRPATRCRMGVSITSSELTGCNGNVCPVGETIGLLFTGPPKGC